MAGNLKARSPGLERPDSIIRKTLQHMGSGYEKKYYMHWILWHWPEIVGGFIANNTIPQGIRKDTLFIYSDNSALRNELQMMMPQIVQSVNNYAGQKMISKVAFTKKWETSDSAGIDEIRLAAMPSELDIGQERRKMPLSPAEMQAAETLAAGAEDPDIATAVAGLYRKHMQMQKLKIARNYQKCPLCGQLMEPGLSICADCNRKKQQKLREKVRQVLHDMPWARYPDVKEYVPECTPKIVNEQRSIMVQKLAADTDVNDRTSIQAKTLVMLYRCLPPDQLTEDNITRALYALRFDMHRPKDYKAPKRYDVIKLGRK
ncbi:Protein of unknown function [Selenomonas ruminantium]|uniref:DUF721 domain-containing protein n=1 Tax=Selenomonas ruminantium TaxID=971 RepID=A0A1M6S2Q7_SELRU|nr:DUF721 domain-containing protein [Selenomonas ruminantium]SHK39033.1 Protein of unknown function [Selenomonas ruminantium]